MWRWRERERTSKRKRGEGKQGKREEKIDGEKEKEEEERKSPRGAVITLWERMQAACLFKTARGENERKREQDKWAQTPAG